MTEEQQNRLEKIRGTFDGKLVYSAAVKDLIDMVDGLSKELDEARETNRRLNRRLGEYQAAMKESLDSAAPKNRSLGRALANLAAAEAIDERNQLRAEVLAWKRATDHACGVILCNESPNEADCEWARMTRIDARAALSGSSSGETE